MPQSSMPPNERGYRRSHILEINFSDSEGNGYRVPTPGSMVYALVGLGCKQAGTAQPLQHLEQAALARSHHKPCASMGKSNLHPVVSCVLHQRMLVVLHELDGLHPSTFLNVMRARLALVHAYLILW